MQTGNQLLQNKILSKVGKKVIAMKNTLNTTTAIKERRNLQRKQSLEHICWKGKQLPNENIKMSKKLIRPVPEYALEPDAINKKL